METEKWPKAADSPLDFFYSLNEPKLDASLTVLIETNRKPISIDLIARAEKTIAMTDLDARYSISRSPIILFDAGVSNVEEVDSIGTAYHELLFESHKMSKNKIIIIIIIIIIVSLMR